MACLATEMALFSALCFLLAFVHISMGCSPIPGKGPDSLEERFYYSDIVAYGKIVNTYKPSKPIYDTVYTAEMELYCTFKGRVMPKMFNISDAGIVPGLCHSTNLTKGGLFTVFLDEYDGRFTPIYKEDIATDQYLEEISLLCDHDINFPVGITEESSAMTCPENYHDYAGCIKYVEPEMDDKGLNVKPLPEKVVPGTNPEPSSNATIAEVSGDTKTGAKNGNNGSDIIKSSCILSVVCVILAFFL